MTWSLESCVRAVCGYAGRVVDEFRSGLEAGFDADDGFDEEAADAYLQADGAERLAEREALEDVAEPRHIDALPQPRILETLGLAERDAVWRLSTDLPYEADQLRRNPAVYGWRDGYWRWSTDGQKWTISHIPRGDLLPSSFGRAWIEVLDWQPNSSPGGSQENSPAEVDGVPPHAPPPSASAGPPDWEGWAVPAIQEVLAEHRPAAQSGTGLIFCPDGAETAQYYDGWEEWREHVAPIIAARIACDPDTAAQTLHATLQAMRDAEQRVDDALHKFQK